MVPPVQPSDSLSNARVEAIKATLNAASKFWPLTPRQIFYLMVSRGRSGRALSDFAAFTSSLWEALRQGQLPPRSVWEAPQDLRLGGAWENQEDFVRAEVQDLLWGYRRNLLQGQPRYIEVWLEKAELADFFAAVALDYCVSTVVCSPSPELSFFRDLNRRIEDLPPGRAGVPGQRPEVVALYFGDYEPAAPDDLVSLRQALRDQGGIWDITLKRVALTRKLVREKSLPPRVRLSLAEEVIHPGVPLDDDQVVELEALDPKSMVSLLRRSIEAELDMGLFENQKELQKRDLAALDRLRADFLRRIEDLLPE